MFPIDEILPALVDALESRSTALLSAPPGAGKTTRVPPALMDASWRGDGKILMLEPRRLAARAAAGFMARERGETVGQTIGYRTRLDTRVSAKTRIEVVTEGILTRMVQRDPGLDGVACVIFDEFHERSLNADLGLALVREIQQALRPDLRLLVMSATLAIEPLKALLDHPPLLSSQGKSFPVEVHYRPRPRERRLDDFVAASVLHALNAEPGSQLVFLPGVGEIKRVAERLEGQLPQDVDLCPLFGQMTPEAQDRAIAPSPSGRRKVVLATAIAESSLTIEGIRMVIDAGQQRRNRFDPNTGMDRLVTEPVSRASADQRAGRAGRLMPGVCFRLWSEGEQARLRAHTPAEILDADLASLVLELAQWGSRDPTELAWLDPPPAAHWQQAVDLLVSLGALDAHGGLTPHGQNLLGLGLPPRLAQLVIRGREQCQGRLGAELAALLSDRDLLPPGSGSDIADRLRALKQGGRGVSRGRLHQARQLADKLSQRSKSQSASNETHADPAALLALAFPDRIGQARGPRGRFLLANGRGAWLPEDDPLAGQSFVVAAELDGQGREARIFLAAALSQALLEARLAERIDTVTVSDWDDARGQIIARRQRLLGALVLEETEIRDVSPEQLSAGLLSAVARRGINALPWTEPARQWQARVGLLAKLWPDDWPDLSDERLAETLDDWLAPYLVGARRWADIEKLDLPGILQNSIDHAQRQALEQLAPRELTVPSGRTVKLDYTAGETPVLACKLQSLFGWQASPTVARGQVPVLIHLLSPAGRPLAVTADLTSFWQNAYPDVRKDMRGRYPKHPWPEDPLSAQAQDGVKHPRRR
ncbi:MAG: ATP-dependent helicase HrpB [Wenzhouxiangella sp.]